MSAPNDIMKRTYSLPSTSQTCEPCPRSRTIGPGEKTAAPREGEFTPSTRECWARSNHCCERLRVRVGRREGMRVPGSLLLGRSNKVHEAELPVCFFTKRKGITISLCPLRSFLRPLRLDAFYRCGLYLDFGGGRVLGQQTFTQGRNLKLFVLSADVTG